MSRAAADPVLGRPGSGAARARGVGFGLGLDAGFAVPGLRPEPEGGPAGPPRALRLERVGRADLIAGWRPRAPQRIATRRDERGRRLLAIDADEHAGWMLDGPGFGRFHLEAGAALVRCAPLRGMAAWRWQRFLIGQVLPFAAVVRGLEVMHSSAVAIDGHAVAITGTSGAGKSSLAVHLSLRGHPLLADDVVALERDGERVAAHPGVGVASVRHAAARQLGEERCALLGRQLGDDGEALRIDVAGPSEPAPLAAFFFVERHLEPADAGGADGLVLEELTAPDPRLLLASTFNFVVRTPERLTRQLDVCALIAGTASVVRLTVGPDVGPAEAATAIERHVRGAIARRGSLT